MALNEVIQTINTNKELKLLTDLLSLDVSNAFNTVRWSHIMKTLSEKKVPSYLIKRIRDFLRDGKIVGEEDNIEFEYNIGVPQGSCLGRILFLLIADRLLQDTNINDKTKMFVDKVILSSETAAYRFSHSIKDPLDKVSNWAEKKSLVQR